MWTKTKRHNQIGAQAHAAFARRQFTTSAAIVAAAMAAAFVLGFAAPLAPDRQATPPRQSVTGQSAAVTR
jgi:hypothetical protein